MMKKKPYIISSVQIEDFAAEGISIAKHEGKVIFVKNAVPGDVADIEIYKEKKNYAEASLARLIRPSDKRQEAFCTHFSVCGGCKWQNVQYAEQLAFKQKQVITQLTHIGKLTLPPVLPILASFATEQYRNKLEFSFSHKKWLTDLDAPQGPALGFHIPGRFDKILDIKQCYLQPNQSNQIRNFVRQYAMDYQLSFFDIREQRGLLRNIIFRNNRLDEWMVILVIAADKVDAALELLNALSDTFPQIVSLQYVLNTKKNDAIHDLPVHLFKGQSILTETLDNLRFQIRPKSFFQTNTLQAEALYRAVRQLAQIQPYETVYDLYTGTGTIACFLAKQAHHVVGIEYVQDAIDDARQNAEINQITNTSFYAGDMKDIFNATLFEKHGRPDVIITDPPRAGMHSDVVEMLINSEASRIVYVSCNPATQARDLAMMTDTYTITAVQPVDMFPHTQHVENIVLLERK